MTPLLDSLLRASVHGALFAAAVWAVCRLCPGLPAGLRCALWWLACLKILVSFAWVSPVELPLLPAPEPVPATVLTFQIPNTPSPVEQAPRLTWPMALAAVWLTGLLAQLGGIVRQLAQARRIVRRACPVGEPWIAERFAELRRALGLGERTELRVSDEVEAPQVMGLLRPVVLLPDARPLSPPDVSMALCHELVHVRRADLWWGWVPALAQRLFWFHPLVRLSAREYALAREAACDAEVLRVLDPEPRAYGRLLLRLGVAPRASRMAAAGAAPSVQTLKRRLQMLEQSSENRRFPLGWVSLIVLVALVALVPFRMVAQEAPEAPEAAEPAPAPEPAPAAEPAPAPEAVPAVEAVPVAAPALPPAPPAPAAIPVVAPAPRAARPALAPMPAPPAPGALPAPAPVARVAQVAPVPPVPPVPPAPPAPPKPHSWPKGESYILLMGDHRTVMNGSADDIHRARELQKGDEPLLYFRKGGKTYVVRDAALVKKAEELFRPQMELGAKQGKLGAQQAALGAKQAELGGRQAALGAKQAALAAKLAQSGEEAGDLEQEMEELNRQQGELGEKQGELGRQQGELGEQQAEMGRQQERLGQEAEKQFRALIQDAVRSGAAQEVER